MNNKKSMKTILFASVIAAMILPFSMMDFAEAQEQTKSEKRFAKFLKLAEKQTNLTAKLDNLVHRHEANPDNQRIEDRIDRVQDKIDRVQERMDRLQQKEIDAVAISASELSTLESDAAIVMSDIRNPNSARFLNENASYFIDQIDRSIIVTVSEDMVDPYEVQRNSAHGEIPGLSPLDTIEYKIDVIRKNSHFGSCNDREEDCNYGIGGLAIKQGSETSTLGFSAVQTDGDRGFVTVAHGVNYQGAIVKQYPDRVVGTVDVLVNGNCDCAFVKANSELRTIYRVYTDPSETSTITSYATTSNPNIGTWLMISGVTSEVQYGQYRGWDEATKVMVTDYSSQNGDSGAPLTTIGSNVKLYGMHHSNSIFTNYSYATPYDTLKTQLSLQ